MSQGGRECGGSEASEQLVSQSVARGEIERSGRGGHMSQVFVCKHGV